MVRVLWLVSLLAFAASCSSSSTGPGPAEPAPGPLAPGQWEELARSERADFMKKTVLPTMSARFQEHDPARFAEMGCRTCHGQSYDNKTFTMPNPELPPLTPEMITTGASDSEAATAFNHLKVTTMATLLGKSARSPENPEGFGCLACHTTKH